MDGLLVDTEPLWHRAEVEILGDLGVPLHAGDTRATKGMFVREVTRYWFERYPWAGPDTDQVADQVVDRVGALVLAEGRMKPGVDQVLTLCADHGLALAVASSTEYRLIELILGHFDLRRRFELVHSAQDEPYGKPHPGVFLSAASRLGAEPSRCLVWEDAPAGVLAAKAARMACVAVPDPAERAEPAMGLADAVLASLAEADDALLERLGAAHWADPLAAPAAAEPPGVAPRSSP